MDEDLLEILNNLPMLEDRSPNQVLASSDSSGQLPAVGDLGLRFLKTFLGSDQYREIQELLKISEQDLETYRTTVQSLQLTALQMRILGSIDDHKLANAPLKDLVAAFKVLKDKELVMAGKPTEIHGLAGYLQILERDPNLTSINLTSEEGTYVAEPLPRL